MNAKEGFHHGYGVGGNESGEQVVRDGDFQSDVERSDIESRKCKGPEAGAVATGQAD